MVKRKSSGDEKPLASKTKMEIDGEDDDDDDTEDSGSILNVDFEWFDPQPAVDFHGLKTLLRQLFDVDNDLFDLSELADLVLAQPLLGSTVKCEGNESDPYAFLTVLNMQQHRSKPVIQQLAKYLVERSEGQGKPGEELKALLAEGSTAQVGLILCERLINMPAQVVPPMYTMLIEEMQWALQEKEPYNFTHYVFVSKNYTEVASKLDAEDSQPQKKARKGGTEKEAVEVFYFHPEDEVWQKFAMGGYNFEFVKAEDEGASDARRTFQELGVKPQGSLLLMDAEKFEEAVKAVSEYVGGAS
ncbi:hypothetical protein K431DRAFT_122419 [Polychaeton citri CBS 116435]|uniref:Protein BCP1 n=1 Tax=Polychaeton citri CBS 116435 TaxID=1314669 RepID=A0A9P4Q3G1_9PEZI|nr:hypothetical protein K431DRAFT_122419 [Polychaeton citri CBS 116435]